ncbi:MAG: transposase family protein [Ruminococcus sp.]|nr:transposase family protein [Ruminococcus sp.]
MKSDTIEQGDKMDFYGKTVKLSDKDFKQIVGVKRETFDAMVTILKEAYARKPRKWRGGRKKKLTMEEQLLMTLKYLRQYVTQKELAFEFEVGEATVCDTIRWVEDTLIKDGTFSLPGKKVLLEDESIEVVLVDVTECPVERPQKNKENVIPAKRNGTR